MKTALKELLHILKLGGRIMIVTPDLDGTATEENRPHFEELLVMIDRADSWIIEIWRMVNPDFSVYYRYKLSSFER